MSGIRSIKRGNAQYGFATSTSAPIRVDDSTNTLKIIPAGSGTVEQTVYSDGTGVASQRMLKTVTLGLVGTTIHGGAVGIVNPEAVDAFITNAYVVITTHATGANGLIDVGETPTGITTASATLIDGVLVGSGVTVPVAYSSVNGAATTGLGPIYWPVGKWVTVSDDGTADVSGFLGTLYIQYFTV